MASRFSIEAVFKAVDKISNPLKKMGINSKKFTKAIKNNFAKAQRAVKRFTSNLKRNITNAIKVGFVGAIAAAGFALRSFIGEASKIEDAVAGFTPLLGGVKKAEELVEKLNQTAATTPFQFANISAAAKQLLPVMNQDIEKTIETFRMLGDTAGGDAQKLESITRGFTKSLLKGKVDLESLNMIAEAGVPIFDQLAKNLGVTTQDMFKMVSAGEVTTDALTDTFRTMTSEGGLFFNGMEIASKTFSGRMSTLKDTLALTAAKIGGALLPIVKKFVDKGIEVAAVIREWVSQNEDLIKNGFEKFITVAKIVFNIMKGIVKVAIAVVKFLKPFMPIILGIVAAFAAYSAILGIAALAQLILNTIMGANPISIIIIAIGVLIGLIIILVKNWESVTNFLSNVWKAVVNFVVGGLTALWNKFKELTDNPFFTSIGLLFAPWLTIPGLILKHWEPIKQFFIDLWENILKPIVEGIGGIVGAVGGFIGGLFGGGGEQQESTVGQRAQGAARGGVITQGERVSRSISETTNRSEIIVRNNGTTGVETDSGIIPPGGSIMLQPSG